MAHAHPASTPRDTQRRLAIVLGTTIVIMIVEAVGGLLTGSLALLADAGHMLCDVGAIALALFAAWFAARPSGPRNTFGYQRIEILVAQINAVLLGVVLVFVVREAVLRLRQPPEIDVLPMALLGTLGLVGNLFAVRMLHRDAGTSLNVRGAYLEVLSDLLASIGVLVAAGLTSFFRWEWADPIVSIGIAVFLLPRIWLLLREVTDVLMESAPRGIDVDALRSALLEGTGVTAVHDLHIWAITPNRVCLSAHVVGRGDADRDRMLLDLNEMLARRFGIRHTTLQVEGPDHVAFREATTGDPCAPCAPAEDPVRDGERLSPRSGSSP
jgi:cobalt-zinc-cadmium efflux system protein